MILYALPELDGAIDPLPLGGLASDDIFLCPERVGALGARLRAWAALRRSPNAAKRVAVVVYGFPPGVGAVVRAHKGAAVACCRCEHSPDRSRPPPQGTAALLDVPASIDSLLRRLRDEGYDLGVAPCEELPSGYVRTRPLCSYYLKTRHFLFFSHLTRLRGCGLVLLQA